LEDASIIIRMPSSSLCVLAAVCIASASGLQLNAAARPSLTPRVGTISAVESWYDSGTRLTSEQAKPAAGYQTYYDDETGDEPIKYADGSKKPEISSSMRERLINESRGLGADPSAKNPFLLVFGGVGVFVVLGALAVNM
jgi:hypothetical protein